MQATAIGEASVVDTLDEVSRLHAVRADAEAGLFELAATFADQHCGDGLPVSRRVLPGMERSVQVGGVGTPRIAEFAYAELGAADADQPVVRETLCRGRARRAAPAATDLGPGDRPPGAGRERPPGRRPDPAPLDAGRRGGGCGDGGLRGRVAAVGPVRGPAGRQGRRRRSGDRRRARAGPGRRAVRETDPVQRAGHRRVLRPVHGRGDRPDRGDRGVPGRRARRVRRHRCRGPPPGQGDGPAGQPGPGRGAARRLRRPAAPRTGLDTLDHPDPGLDKLDHLDPGLDRLDHPEELLDHPDSGLDRLDHPAASRAGGAGRCVGADGRLCAAGRVHPDPATRTG